MLLDLVFSALIGIVSFFTLANIVDYPLAKSFYLSVVISTTSLLLFVVIHFVSQRLSIKSTLSMSIGIVISMTVFIGLSQIIDSIDVANNLLITIKVISLFFLMGLGISFGIYKSNQDIYPLGRFTFANTKGVVPKILDTSVIIDGRVADVAEVGFLEGDVIIPSFIIKELQYIADSPDPIRKVRGKRGLDIIKKMQSELEHINIKIIDHDFPSIKEADLKLVELAKMLNGILVTNDSNLNKIATIQHINILNLNELSHALRPVVLPEHTIYIQLVKEGRDTNQAIGYLDDGTMVVVNDGVKYLGKQVNVLVKSVMQTTTGRMIFASITEEETTNSYVNA